MIFHPGNNGFLRRAALAGAAAVLAVATPAAAAPIVFFGFDNINSIATGPGPASTLARTQFVNAVGAASISTQDFESFGLGDLPASSPGVFAKGVGVTLDNTSTTHLRISPAIGAFLSFATSGSRHLESVSDQGTTHFTATFDQPVRAIGFYATDVSDWACCHGEDAIGKLRVVLTTASGTQALDLTPGLDPRNLVDGNVEFFGVLDDAEPFISIAIRSDGDIPGGDAIGLDDIMISTRVVAAPAPGTLPLLLGLLPLLGFLRRRDA